MTLAIDDGLNAQRVLLLQIDESHQLVDALNAAIRTAHPGHSNSRSERWARAALTRLTDEGMIELTRLTESEDLT